MTQERLRQLSTEDLLHLARIFNVDIDDDEDSLDTDRDALEEMVSEAMDDARGEQEQDDTYPINYYQRRYENVDELFGRKRHDDDPDFTFPESYNVTRIELMLKDPAWAFAYWDISQSERAMVFEDDLFSGFMLRLEELNPAKKITELDIMDVPVSFSDNSWYLNLELRETRYVVHLVALFGSVERILASSKPVYVPRGGFSEKLDVLDSFETDALIALSGIETLGVAKVLDEVPQRIMHVMDSWED